MPKAPSNHHWEMGESEKGGDWISLKLVPDTEGFVTERNIELWGNPYTAISEEAKEMIRDHRRTALLKMVENGERVIIS